MARPTYAKGTLARFSRVAAIEARCRAFAFRGRSIGYALACAAAVLVSACGGGSSPNDTQTTDPALIAKGKQIFRFDTFGDETKWTDALHMNDVIAAAVDPMTALSVGLKVDADALPADVVAAIQSGAVDLTKPSTTITLLKLNAVVGVQGTVTTTDGVDTLTSVGVTCALCHSTVDDSFAPGIGKRLDGWPNHDLNPGGIIALSPALTPDQKAVFSSWGKGLYDPRYNQDGQNGPQAIPPAYGLEGVHKVTVTGDGENLEYWNRYVAVTQMGGHGTFNEPRTGVNVTNGTDDLVTAKLGPLQAYQLSIAAPPPPCATISCPICSSRSPTAM